MWTYSCVFVHAMLSVFLYLYMLGRYLFFFLCVCVVYEVVFFFLVCFRICTLICVYVFLRGFGFFVQFFFRIRFCVFILCLWFCFKILLIVMSTVCYFLQFLCLFSSALSLLRECTLKIPLWIFLLILAQLHYFWPKHFLLALKVLIGI